MGLVIIDITMARPIILVYFFPTKTMEIILKKSILGIRCENMALGTELTRNFCAGIGPL